MYDIQALRKEFPILGREVYGRPLVYLDNAATTQKPRAVVEAMTEQYYSANANVHRGVHYLSQLATKLHEDAREAVRAFIGARSTNEIVFTQGTTESLNLVATSYGQAFLGEGDEIILTQMEHHSNIVPWQMLAGRTGVRIKVVPVAEDGRLDLEAYERLFTPRTRLVAVCHVSNVLGTANPVERMARTAHAHGAHILVDAAQSVPHTKVDVGALGCDFLTFSGHKIYGPTGVGVLYGREELLERMPPYQGGGEMIGRVSFEGTTYADLPFKFEAGTPDYVGTHALATALGFVQRVGLEAIGRHERALTRRAIARMQAVEGMKIYGETAEKGAVIAFNVGQIHPLDLGTLLDRLGIAIRTGHHCAQPLMARYGVESMARLSLALYNTEEEIDAFADALERVVRMF